MSAQSMLEQLLKSGLSMLDNPKNSTPVSGGNGQKTDSEWGKFGAGAAAGGVLGLLLGSKRGRSMGGSALKYGSIAALGVVAFKAYNQWQAQQSSQSASSANPSAPASSTNTTQPTLMLAAPSIEDQSQAMLKAMIAAAKSDGHLDDRERELIEAELKRIDATPEEHAWMKQELNQALDPAQVARAATTPELAAQMYLASLIMVDSTNFMERAYLDELARQLKLAPELKAELELQAQSNSSQ